MERATEWVQNNTKSDQLAGMFNISVAIAQNYPNINAFGFCTVLTFSDGFIGSKVYNDFSYDE